MSPLLGFENTFNRNESTMDINQDSNHKLEELNINLIESSTKTQKRRRGRQSKVGELSRMDSSGRQSPIDASFKVKNMMKNSPSESQFNCRSSISNYCDNDDRNLLEPGELLKSSKNSKVAIPEPEITISNGLPEKNASNKRSSMRKSVKEPEQPQIHPQIGNDQAQSTLDLIAALILGPDKDQNERITMINMNDGTRITGKKAPKRSELPNWIMNHPNHYPESEEFLQLLKNTCLLNNRNIQMYLNNNRLSAHNEHPKAHASITMKNIIMKMKKHLINLQNSSIRVENRHLNLQLE
jgi:hypothetical protein